MNITRICNRIEIAFWTAWIAALRSPRLGRVLLQTLLITAAGLFMALVAVCLLAWNQSPHPAGRTARAEAGLPAAGSPAIGYPAAGEPVTGAPDADGLVRPANGQRNLLVVLVDRLEVSRPRLQGVWLLARSPLLAQVTFLPVYPSGGGASRAFDERLEMAFSGAPAAKSSETLPTEFVHALEAQGLWWDHYLEVDKAGLAGLAELMGGMDLGDGRLSGRQLAAGMPAADQDPQAAVSYQSQIAREICSRSSNLLSSAAQPAVVALFENRSRSDLDPLQVRLALHDLPGMGGIACQFPTLAGR